MTPNTRYHDLDALRAFAMFLGLVVHGLMSFIPIGFWPAQDMHMNAEVVGVAFTLIHGFRMPLFFLLSGFFMMLLWQRRGTKQLVKNRAIRILVPLVVGTLLILPMAIGINQWGNAKKAVVAKAMQQNSVTIWQAAKLGDIDKVNSILDIDSAALKKRDRMGISVLAWACVAEEIELIDELIERGADVNDRDRAGRTVLHVAAFFGCSQAVEKLLDSGAEVNVIGSGNHTPLDSTYGPIAFVKGIAGAIQLEVDLEAIEAARPEIQEMLIAAGGKRAEELGVVKDQQSNATLNAYRMIAFWPIFYHLWFLHYLVWFVIVFLMVAPLLKSLPIPRLSGWLIRPPICLIWLIPLTTWVQSLMGEELGADTASGLFIWPPIFLYYGVFVLFGVLAYGRGEFTQSSRWGWVVYLIVGIGAGVAVILSEEMQQTPDWLQLTQPVFAAIYTWSACFGLIGLFRMLFSRESRRIRWLSDSCYWLYIAHLPVIMALQIWVSDWDVPWYLKLVGILICTTVALLIIYHLAIRYTFVGAVLNGKKEKSRPG